MPTNNHPHDLVYVNGINASTGDYINAPLTHTALAEQICTIEQPLDDDLDRDVQSERAELRNRTLRLREPSFRAAMGVDERDLAQTGWSVVFAHNSDPALKDALAELLQRRREQAGDRYHEYSGENGFLPGDTWESFRIRHRIGAGEADPDQMPYYVLLVGSPAAIPYRFQYQLDVERAVGRIAFPDVNDYAQYAHSVVEAEKHPLQLPPRATFFATCNPDDQATQLSSQYLVEPLHARMVEYDSDQHWRFEAVCGDQAGKDRLSQLLGGTETPALLLSATHGAGFNADDPCHPRHQGALITQEWPGRREWSGHFREDFYFSADDVSDNARLWGLIAIFFACFSAGTPALSDFYHLKERGPREQLQLAQEAFLARLPQRLLSHPRGGALAVVGHIERAWTNSFLTSGIGGTTREEIKAYAQLLELLLRGYPSGVPLCLSVISEQRKPIQSPTSGFWRLPNLTLRILSN